MQSPSHQTRRHMITAKTLRTGPRPVRGIYGPIAPLKICLAMLLTAQIGITFLIATIALTKIRRAPAFHNFMFIIWIGTFTYLLLFYTGQYEADIPRPEVCAAQAIMKHGADSAAVSALFLLSVESWRLAIREKANSKSSRSWLILTLAIPYAHFVAFATITAIFVNANPQNAYRTLNSFYCTLRNVPFGIIQGVELNALVLFAVIFQVKTGLLYWKRRKVVGKYKPTAEGSVDLSTFVRLAVFTLWQIIGLLINAGSFGSRFWTLKAVRYAMSIIAASIPFVVFLVFSTQKDVIFTWCFWKAMKPPHNRGSALDRVGNPAIHGPTSTHHDLVVSEPSASAYESPGSREPGVSLA